MSDTIYLYLKTHNVTGLKYLGKTVQDPFTYKGSGTWWKAHLKKYGNDVSTEILYQSNDPQLFRDVAKQISTDLNIVESKSFANLCPEEGQGGFTVYTEDRAQKISEALKGVNTWSVGNTINRDTVTAIDGEGNTIKVSKMEFDGRRDLIGVASRNKGMKKPECWMESQKQHMEEFQRKRSTIVEIDGIIYKSISEAGRQLGVPKDRIMKMVRDGYAKVIKPSEV